MKTANKTKTPSSNENVRHRAWCLTINNYTQKDIDILNEQIECCTYIIVGDEVGSSGTPHLQCYLHFKSGKTFTSIKKKFSTAHIEDAKGSAKDNKKYCSKEGKVILEHGKPPSNIETRVSLTYQEFIDELLCQLEKNPQYTGYMKSIWYARYSHAIDNIIFTERNNRIHEKNMKKYDTCTLLEWQEKVINLLDRQSDRSVLWIADEVGDTGKTWLSGYLTRKHNFFLCVATTMKDIAMIFKRTTKASTSDGYIFDLSRGGYQNIYDLLEGIKTQVIGSGKYDGTQVFLSSNKVVVFSNSLPEINELSEDRWNIYKLYRTDDIIKIEPYVTDTIRL
jgi:hypothetical protein